MGPLAVLLLAATVDGEAALRHAAALASLGPHPWGSPRGRAAAAYVAAQLRQAGLGDVRLDEFEVHGVRGVNVVGSVRGAGRGTVVVGAHHDTAPEAPGAYDDGGGVGIVIELARLLAHSPPPPRTVMFASWDGEEAWSSGQGTVTGSRAFVRGLGAGARDVTAAIVVEMSGWRGGTPVLHPIAYADPLRPGRHVIAPGWPVSAALSGARDRAGLARVAGAARRRGGGRAARRGRSAALLAVPGRRPDVPHGVLRGRARPAAGGGARGVGLGVVVHRLPPAAPPGRRSR